MEVFKNSLWHLYEFSSELSFLRKIFNLNDITNESNEDFNLKWPYIPDRTDRMVIIGGSGSGKSKALLIIKEQVTVSLTRFICMLKI